MIARADNLGHFEILDLLSHSNSLYSLFALGILVKKCYRRKEVPRPDTFRIFGSSVLYMVAVFYLLGNCFTNHNGLSSIFPFSDDIDVEHAADRAKETYSKNLRNHIFF